MTRWERKKLKNIERIERGCDEKGKIKIGEDWDKRKEKKEKKSRRKRKGKKEKKSVMGEERGDTRGDWSRPVEEGLEWLF